MDGEEGGTGHGVLWVFLAGCRAFCGRFWNEDVVSVRMCVNVYIYILMFLCFLFLFFFSRTVGWACIRFDLSLFFFLFFCLAK